MKENVLQIMQRACPDIDLLASDSLVDDGLLDSLLLITVVAELKEEFGIIVPYTEIKSENFNSVDAIAAMVERLSKAAGGGVG